MKKCTKCGKLQRYSNFTVNKAAKDGLSYWCRSCHRQYRKDTYRAKSHNRIRHVVIDGRKQCSICREWLPVDKFPKNSSSVTGYAGYCKSCYRARDKARYAPRTKKAKTTKTCPSCKVTFPVKAYKSAYCPDCQKSKGRTRWLAKHGLTVEQFDQLWHSQGGVCLICRQVPTKICVDHDHSCCPGNTGCLRCIRGLLCHQCNTAIAFLRESPTNARRLADYVESGVRPFQQRCTFTTDP